MLAFFFRFGIAFYTDVALREVVSGTRLTPTPSLLFRLAGDIDSPEPELKGRSTLTPASPLDCFDVMEDDMGC